MFLMTVNEIEYHETRYHNLQCEQQSIKLRKVEPNRSDNYTEYRYINLLEYFIMNCIIINSTSVTSS
jgi:hypothetical protein